MSTIVAAQPMPWARWLAGAAAGVGVLLLVAAPIIAGGEATSHAWFHATFSLLGILPALAIALRRPRGGSATTAPLVGFVMLAATQLVEGIGALGYGSNGYDRVNALAALHDVGLLIAPIGLIVGAIGVTIGVAVLLLRRTGRPIVAAVVAVAIVGPLLVIIAKLVGL